MKAKTTLSRDEQRAYERIDRQMESLRKAELELDKKIIEHRAPCKVGDMIEFNDGGRGIVTRLEIPYSWPSPKRYIRIWYRPIRGKNRVLRNSRHTKNTEGITVVEPKSERTIAMLQRRYV